MVALSRLRSGNSQSMLVSTSDPQVDPRLGVHVGDVDEYIYCWKSDADASRRPPLSITMSSRKSLPVLKGAPLSTRWRTDIRFREREVTWPNGLCWFVCVPAR